MQQAFIRRRVEAMKPVTADIANEMIDGLTAGGGCYLLKRFAINLTLRVVGTMVDATWSVA
jgi:cytochrome P450